MNEDRFQRQKALFGAIGQDKLNATKVVLVGYGGLGSCAFEELMHLGAARITVIEPQIFDLTNHNRYFGSHLEDVGKRKLDIALRNGALIDPKIPVEVIHAPLQSQEAFKAIKKGEAVIASLDHDGPRLVLNELCIAYNIPLIDLASDVPEEGIYGGRVAVVRNGNGCLYCRNLLDMEDVRRYFSSQEQKENEAAVYGIPVRDLESGTGPSVMPINGIIASMGVLEYMVMITGMREPLPLFNYYGHTQKTGHTLDVPEEDCIFCSRLGWKERANVERYILS